MMLFKAPGNYTLLMWLLTNENKRVTSQAASQEGLVVIRALVFTQAMHHCHHKFIIRSATAGLAVNGFNWLLTTKLALWCTSNTGRLAMSEEG